MVLTFYLKRSLRTGEHHRAASEREPVTGSRLSPQGWRLREGPRFPLCLTSEHQEAMLSTHSIPTNYPITNALEFPFDSLDFM